MAITRGQFLRPGHYPHISFQYAEALDIQGQSVHSTPASPLSVDGVACGSDEQRLDVPFRGGPRDCCAGGEGAADRSGVWIHIQL